MLELLNNHDTMCMIMLVLGMRVLAWVVLDMRSDMRS